MGIIKQSTFDVLNKSGRNGIIEKIFDIVIIFLIITNSIAVVIEPSIKDAGILDFLRIFEIVSVIIFSVEYLLRLWTSDYLYPDKSRFVARLLYIITPMALIDLAAVLPFYIPFDNPG